MVHINGEDGWLGGWTRIPHSVGKGGLRTLTKSLASGLGQYGITVNDVSPGFIDTARDVQTRPEVTPDRTQTFLPAIPIRRQPTPEEAGMGVRLPVLDTFSRHHRCGYPRQRRPMDVRIRGPSVPAVRSALPGSSYRWATTVLDTRTPCRGRRAPVNLMLSEVPMDQHSR